MADTVQQSILAFEPSSTTFSFDAHAVRLAVLEGEPWFVAKDVMVALEYASNYKPATALSHIPDEWKGVYPIHTPGGEQKMLCLSEPGLYFFLGRSDKPKALPFQKKVAGEVLPCIRKTGRYTAPGREKTLNEMVDLFVMQVETPNGAPTHLFMPLVNAVLRKRGFDLTLPTTNRTEASSLLPAAQAKEITDRLERLGKMFHPFSDQFLDVLGVTRALRGLHPNHGTPEPSYQQTLPRHPV